MSHIAGPQYVMHELRIAAVLALLAVPAAAHDLPPGFVYLRDVDASIAQDIRYAGANNFTAHPLPGYGAAECVLRRDVAEALAKVARDLARDRLGLKVYDCYRPQRAVAAMWRWAYDAVRKGDARFYPYVKKRDLFALGYIAARSRHASGTAVDLTLVPLETLPARSRAGGNLAIHGPCTAPAAERAPDNSLDMGTGFDCFDAKSTTNNASIAPAQRRARLALKAAMTKRGFKNYFREWWHYEYGAPRGAYDVPIGPR